VPWRAREVELPLAEELATAPVFAALSRQERDRIAALVHLRRYVPGETVIRCGAPQSGFYWVRRGWVGVVRTAADGRQVDIDHLGPGSLVGEFGLFDSAPRSSSVVALAAVELAGFFRPDLMALMDVYPATGCRLLLQLATQLTVRLEQDYAALVALGWSPETSTADREEEATG
jgi:CRP-like cAMP-binding protein